MDGAPQPSRALLVIAGAMTQLVGVAYLVLALASIPVAHDLHAGTHALIAAVIAALAAIVCGALVYRARLIPLALAAGLDVGFGVGLPRGNSTVGSIVRMLPEGDASTAEALVTAGAILMFLAAIVCVIAIPTALKVRAWARGELQRQPSPSASRASEAALPGSSLAGSTLRGLGPAKLMPTQVLRLPGGGRAKPLVIVGVAIALIALGVVIISAAAGGGDDASDGSGALAANAGGSGHGSGQGAVGSGATGSGASPVGAVQALVGDAGVPGGSASAPADAAVESPHVEDLIARFHAALATDLSADLGLVFDARAFGFGVAANEIAEGREAVVATLMHDLGPAPRKGFAVVPRFSQVAHTDDVAWIAEELKIGDQIFEVTAVAGITDGVWTLAAVHFAIAMPNDLAYRLGRDGQLVLPDAIPDTHDESPLAVAMRQAFASKPSFVAARSTRADAVNLGSAPGERMSGGDAIRKVFGRIKATLRLHDAVKVGAVGTGGWGAANVEFTDADRDGVQVTQTFRVLVAWIREGADLRIVQTQFSNAR